MLKPNMIPDRRQFHPLLWLVVLFALLQGSVTPCAAQRVQVQEFTLDNGMKFLLLPRKHQPGNIAAGWLAKVGSVNEQPGITGISHLLEHMMFKGTRTIGTRDAERDAALMAAQDDIHRRMLHEILTIQYARFRRGEIDDPWDPANDLAPLRKFRLQLQALIAEHSEFIVPNEFDAIYARHGGSNLNAFTSHDATFYFVTLPSNKLELWAWMESDRLADSVFREFHTERDVVLEERRLTVESTPTGLIQEQFDAMFWQSTPYRWPIIGYPSDVQAITPAQLRQHFDTWYRANNLVGVVVGDFDADEARALIERYFSRLPRADAPPPMLTIEMPQTVEKRLFAECDCPTQVQVRYHTVPFGHADSYALELLAVLLNGRSGRLHKAMIDGLSIATAAEVSVDSTDGPAKYASAFTFTAQSRGDVDPERLEQAWYDIIDTLKHEPVSDRELRKARNQHAANAYRAMQSNLELMLQLGLYESMTGWRYINESPARFAAVTPKDIQRVAQRYFDWSNRSVAILLRREPTEPDDPDLVALDPAVQSDVRGMLKQILPQTDPNILRMIISQIQQMKADLPTRSDAPPDADKAFDYIIRRIMQRIAELEADGSTTPQEAPQP